MTVRLEQLLAAATPGPWAVHEHGEYGDDVRPTDGKTIIAYGEGCFLPDMERANLDLIAKTPDMARLLIDMGEDIQDALAALPAAALGRANHYSALLARLDALGKDTA